MSDDKITKNTDLLPERSKDQIIEDLQLYISQLEAKLETTKEINTFFIDQITPIKLAHQLRRLKQICTKYDLLHPDERSEWLLSSLFWLDSFVETIDPYLERE